MRFSRAVLRVFERCIFLIEHQVLFLMRFDLHVMIFEFPSIFIILKMWLLQKVKSAIAQYQNQRQKLQNIQEIRRRWQSCTPREQEVLGLMVQGLPNKGIAEALSISPRTVDTHRRNLLQKFDVKNTAGLVKYAVENKLLE